MRIRTCTVSLLKVKRTRRPVKTTDGVSNIAQQAVGVGNKRRNSGRLMIERRTDDYGKPTMIEWLLSNDHPAMIERRDIVD